ncbi:hypothetical protein Sjap_006565 [Stephania japonica]|uniref:Cullin family profile domain-containing protein n=1 Tax=Stephania japonica TaxID=461633 RepID=A0AAP0PJV5_9MAGN
MAINERKTIDLEQGWEFMQKGITKLKNILEGLPEPQFSSEDYMMLYTTIYNMCTQKPPHDYSQQLYDKYKESFEEYIVSTVLPTLREKHDEFMLRELVKRWANHKIMVRWLSRFFHYLDRYFIARRSLPALNEVGLTCFRDLIDQEREGEQIDRALLKNVLDIFVEIGMGSMDCYENDFEQAMLNDTAGYYSRKASNWILEDSCPDYMQKAEDCLKREKDRVSHYLHSSSEQKLLEKVQTELLLVYATQLLEKEHSGCHALLRDDKVEDLSRMYRLFSRIPRGLDPVSNIFKQHVTAEGTALVKQAEDAASNKKVFVRKVIDLHDKYLAYVTNCFMNHTLFHKALKEAFEVFCNKGVGGSSSAELLATFCDNILKKGGSEKLSDEAIEETLEKASNLSLKKLARRLLFDKSANDDHERSILTKLKQQCGGQFTSKMEGMVTDLTLAKENQANFEEYLTTNPHAHPGIDLSVTVLTTGFWPSYKSFDLNLPAELIPLPPVDEKKKVIEDVDKDRRYAIDASIVRIMKSRKVLGHQQLVMECVEQLGRMFKTYSTSTDTPVTAFQECLVETSKGPLSVYVCGDQEKPGLVAYPDVALNYMSCFQGLFFCPDAASVLLHNFCIYHIDAPGHETKYKERVLGLMLVSPLCKAPSWTEWFYNKVSRTLVKMEILRDDLSESLKKLQCKSLIFVGESSPFHSEAVHMSAKMDRRNCALVEVQACGSLVTEEHPYSMLIPIEFFLMGFGYYRQAPLALSHNSNPPISSTHSCIAPELLSPESLGIKLKPIKTRLDDV